MCTLQRLPNGTPASYNLNTTIPLDGLFYKFVASGSGFASVSCLLEGTLVFTTTGYRPIETIHVGDSIVSHCGLTRKVTRVGKWICDVKYQTEEQRMYKIPAGSLRAKLDVYVSRFHKISNGTMLLYPTTYGFKEAEPSELTKTGKYTIYHLEVERGSTNYLLVNGGCVVESWIVPKDIAS